jgi:hypothetical protein
MKDDDFTSWAAGYFTFGVTEGPPATDEELKIARAAFDAGRRAGRRDIDRLRARDARVQAYFAANPIAIGTQRWTCVCGAETIGYEICLACGTLRSAQVAP